MGDAGDARFVKAYIGLGGVENKTYAKHTGKMCANRQLLESADLSDAYRHEFEPEADAIYRACAHNAHLDRDKGGAAARDLPLG